MPEEGSSGDTKKQLQELLERLALAEKQSEKSKIKREVQNFTFWNTQPVPKISDQIEEDGCIEPDKPIDKIRKVPYPLPKEFEWTILDVEDDQHVCNLFMIDKRCL